MLPAAFVFCFGGKFVFGGRAFACTAGFFPRFGGSSVARPGGRGEGTPLYCAQTSSLLFTRPSGTPPPYKQFVGSSQFFNMQWGQVAAGSGDPALPNVLCSITHYKMLRRERS